MMERPESLATEILHSLKKDKEFLVMALLVSLIVNAVLAIGAFIKK